MEKLVRDKILGFSEKAGDGRKFRIADDLMEIRRILARKLLEETYEVIDELMNPVPDGTAVIEELGDVVEVVDAIASQLHSSLEVVNYNRIGKREKKGGFTKMVVLDMSTNFDPRKKEPSLTHLCMKCHAREVPNSQGQCDECRKGRRRHHRDDCACEDCRGGAYR